MLCPYRALLNPGVAPAVLPEPHRPRPSRAAGSFFDPIAEKLELWPRGLEQSQPEGTIKHPWTYTKAANLAICVGADWPDRAPPFRDPKPPAAS